MPTLLELKQKAKEMKIRRYSKMNKSELEKTLGIPPPSAYRSMRLSQLNLTKPSKDTESKLKIWKAELWKNLTAKITDDKDLPCGTKGKNQKKIGLPTVCRPTRKVNENTTKLANTFTRDQILKAIEMKKQGKRIIWSQL